MLEISIKHMPARKAPLLTAYWRMWMTAILLSAWLATGVVSAYQPGAYLQDAMVRKAEGSALVSDALAKAPGRTADSGKVQAALRGELEVVNVAWWGFDPEDATEAFQAAIDTHAPFVVVPNMGQPWVLSETVQLVGNQTVLLEEGVEIRARRGAFRHPEECLFSVANLDHLTFIGYGATIGMWRSDYQSAEYLPSEFRHIFWMAGVRDVELRGLVLAESGGDGVMLCETRYGQPEGSIRHCEDIGIFDCRFESNHRQGLSIEDVTNLLVVNCEFYNTSGTAPSNGVDIEPFQVTFRKVVDLVFRDCRFVNNAGGGLTINRGATGPDSVTDSVLFDNCRIGYGSAEGIWVTGVCDAHANPDSLYEFRDCLIEDTGQAGVWVSHKSSLGAKLRFLRCAFRNVATAWDDYPHRGPELALPRKEDWWRGRPIFPIYLYAPHGSATRSPGGVEFVDCMVEDGRPRPVLVAEEYDSDFGLRDVTGNITLLDDREPDVWISEKRENVTLQVTRGEGRLPAWGWEEETPLAHLSRAELPGPVRLTEVLPRPRDVSLTDFAPDPSDATPALQKAVDTRARVVLIPRGPQPWVLGPVYLQGDQEIRIEAGAVLQAKADSFGYLAAMFNGTDKRNIVIRGMGAGSTLELGPIVYTPEPWNNTAVARHGIMLLGCGNVRIENLDISGAPDQGVSIGPNYQYPLFLPSRNVTIANCRFATCRRGGVGVYSARDLRIENCRFGDNGAEGSGVLIQSASLTTWLQGIRVHGCEFLGLRAPAVKADFGSQVRYPYWGYPQRDLDLTVSQCVVRDAAAPAVLVSNLFSKADVDSWPGEGRRTGHWQGALRFVDCDLGTRAGETLRIQEKSALSARLSFENCILRSSDSAAVHIIAGADSRLATPSGGLAFSGCTAYVPGDQPALRFTPAGDARLTDISGTIAGPDGRPMSVLEGE